MTSFVKKGNSMNGLLRILVILFIAYAVFVLLIFLMQRRLLYLPS